MKDILIAIFWITTSKVKIGVLQYEAVDSALENKMPILELRVRL